MAKMRRGQDRKSETTANVQSTPRARVAKASDRLVNRGRVVGYSVDNTGLVVKLDVSAVSRIAFSVSADAPHFRPAVSMTMIALNNRVNPATQEGQTFDHQYLWVKFAPKSSGSEIRPATAVGLSNSNEADPFDIANFVLSLEA